MLDRPLSELLRGRTAPLTLPPGTTVRDACQRMRERAVDAVLVADVAGRCSASSPGATQCAACWRRRGTPTGPRWRR